MRFKHPLSVLLTLAVVLFFSGCSEKQNQDIPAPEGTQWQKVSKVKLRLAVPEHWSFKAVSDENPFIYEITPAGPSFETPSTAKYRLTVDKSKDPETVVEEAKKFVTEIRSQGFPTADIEMQTLGEITTFTSVVKLADKESGDHLSTVAVSSLGNTKTGTLYTIRFDIPVSELTRVAPVANALFQNLQVDDEI